MSTPKNKNKLEQAKYLPEFEKLLSGLMQMYLLRVNGEDIVLFGPLLGWPEEREVEVESIGFGELVRVTDVIEMLQTMGDREKRESVMGKIQ